MTPWESLYCHVGPGQGLYYPYSSQKGCPPDPAWLGHRRIPEGREQRGRASRQGEWGKEEYQAYGRSVWEAGVKEQLCTKGQHGLIVQQVEWEAAQRAVQASKVQLGWI